MGRESIASSLQKPKSIRSVAKVNTISLPEVMKMVKTPDIIIKSDCEGAEYDYIIHTPLEVLVKIKNIININVNSSKSKKGRGRPKKQSNDTTQYRQLGGGGGMAPLK